MKEKTIKKRIIIKIVLLFLVLGMFVSVVLYLLGLEDKTKQKHDWLKNNIYSLQQKVEGLSEQALEFVVAKVVWNEFDEEARKLQGIRISSAKNIVDNLEKKYKLPGFKVTFSKPEPVNTAIYPNLANDAIQVVESSVDVVFFALTDEFAFNFLNDLKASFPGYIQIESFSVDRLGLVNIDNLTAISKGENPSLVSVKLKFIWRDLKHEPANSPTNPETGGQE
jgi:hypothetical protein